jgi:hypothetical protein
MTWIQPRNLIAVFNLSSASEFYFEVITHDSATQFFSSAASESLRTHVHNFKTSSRNLN